MKFLGFCLFLVAALPATSQVITLQGKGPITYSLQTTPVLLFTLSTSSSTNVTLTFSDSLTVFPTDSSTGKITQASVTTSAGKCTFTTATAASQTAVIAASTTSLSVYGCLLNSSGSTQRSTFGSLTVFTILNATASGFPSASQGVAVNNSTGVNTISVTGNNPATISNNSQTTVTVTLVNTAQDAGPLSGPTVASGTAPAWLNYNASACSKQTSSCSVTLSPNPSGLTGATAGSQYNVVLIVNTAAGSQAPILVQYTYTPAVVLFVPVTPCRIADTRNATGSFGGPLISGGTSRSFPIPASACGIPSTAQAYSLNVTAVPNGALGYMTVWPTGQSQPGVSTLNSSDGRVKANAAIVQAGTSGAISVFASNDSNVVLDINGYFLLATSSSLAFYPVVPCRIADTRNATGSLGGPYLGAAQHRTFPVLSSSCNVPSSAQAYSLNFTAVPHNPLGYLTTWPTGQTQPGVSTLNSPTGTVTANAAIVPAGTSGSIDVFVTNDTDLVIDINGYFAPAGTNGLALYTVQPCRVLDTRNPQGSQPFSGSIGVNVASSACAIPSTAQAYVFNATVVPPNPLGYLTLWPPNEPQPVASTLNSLDGATVSNMAIVPTSGGLINSFASNPTHLILDISGYFAP